MTIRDLKRLVMAEIGNEAQFAFINTRVILRTGVNLNHGNGELAPQRVDRVLLELRAMGFLRERLR